MGGCEAAAGAYAADRAVAAAQVAAIMTVEAAEALAYAVVGQDPPPDPELTLDQGRDLLVDLANGKDPSKLTPQERRFLGKALAAAEERERKRDDD